MKRSKELIEQQTLDALEYDIFYDVLIHYAKYPIAWWYVDIHKNGGFYPGRKMYLNLSYAVDNMPYSCDRRQEYIADVKVKYGVNLEYSWASIYIETLRISSNAEITRTN